MQNVDTDVTVDMDVYTHTYTPMKVKILSFKRVKTGTYASFKIYNMANYVFQQELQSLKRENTASTVLLMSGERPV